MQRAGWSSTGDNNMTTLMPLPRRPGKKGRAGELKLCGPSHQKYFHVSDDGDKSSSLCENGWICPNAVSAESQGQLSCCSSDVHHKTLTFLDISRTRVRLTKDGNPQEGKRQPEGGGGGWGGVGGWGGWGGMTGRNARMPKRGKNYQSSRRHSLSGVRETEGERLWPPSIQGHVKRDPPFSTHPPIHPSNLFLIHQSVHPRVLAGFSSYRIYQAVKTFIGRSKNL